MLYLSCAPPPSAPPGFMLSFCWLKGSVDNSCFDQCIIYRGDSTDIQLPISHIYTGTSSLNTYIRRMRQFRRKKYAISQRILYQVYVKRQSRQMVRITYFYPNISSYARLGVFHTAVLKCKEVPFLSFPANPQSQIINHQVLNIYRVLYGMLICKYSPPIYEYMPQVIHTGEDPRTPPRHPTNYHHGFRARQRRWRCGPELRAGTPLGKRPRQQRLPLVQLHRLLYLGRRL